MTHPSPAHVAFSPRRVGAMVLRHWYLLSSSWPRVLDLIYWPAVQMLMWGFLQQYVSQNSGFFMKAAGTFIGAVMLWDILFRGQLGFSISFLEEMYARNLGNLMMSPLRPAEFVAALMIQSIIRLSIGMVPVSLLGDRVLRLQSVGPRARARGVLLESAADELGDRDPGRGHPAASRPRRREHGVELHVPVPAADLRLLPGEVLPSWLQLFAWMLPPTYVFEGMRALIDPACVSRRPDDRGFRPQRRAVRRRGGGFLLFLKSARREGTLLQGGD